MTNRALPFRGGFTLLFGGRSTEHDASLRSTSRVAVDLGDAVAFFVYLTLDGDLLFAEEGPEEDFDMWLEGSSWRRSDWQDVSEQLQLRNSFIINLVIGREGEDGRLSGLAEVLNLPGSFESVGASAMSMDKWASGLIAAASCDGRVRNPETLVVRRGQETPNLLARRLGGGRVVVKGADLGASILLQDFASMEDALLSGHISRVLQYSSAALVQEFIPGDEYSCGVLQRGPRTHVLPVFQIRTHGTLYGHQEKHHSVNGVSAQPVNSEVAYRIGEISERLFLEFGCAFMSRFDFIVRDEDIYFLEFNVVPGMMAGSLFPQMLEAEGLNIRAWADSLRDTYISVKKPEWTYRYEIEDH